MNKKKPILHCLMFALYQSNKPHFAVDRALIQEALKQCEPPAIEALSHFAQPHLWQGGLPVYPLVVAPSENGGWGHLLPMWFKPHERPVPFYTLDNWALFATMYAHSFGPSEEARNLIETTFTVENLVRVVAGSNLLLPFLPSTQGAGLFFRHGMLPFLLSILWLDEPNRRAWLRLHALGAEQFLAAQSLNDDPNPIETLNLLEFAVFARLERNGIETDEAVAALLTPPPAGGEMEGGYSLLDAYRILFGAINLGVTALAQAYAGKPIDAWREWAYQEFAFPYRMPDFGAQAILDFLRRRI